MERFKREAEKSPDDECGNGSEIIPRKFHGAKEAKLLRGNEFASSNNLKDCTKKRKSADGDYLPIFDP